MARRGVDLHTHSTLSDGSDTPEQLVMHASLIGLGAIAITDHESTAGYARALALGRQVGVTLIAGCELTAASQDGQLHLLGLFVDPSSTALNAFLGALRANRRRRNRGLIVALRDRGIVADLDDLVQREGLPMHQLGRRHFARAIVRQGRAMSVQDAMLRFLTPLESQLPANPKPSPEQVIAIIRAAGGVAILAHPSTWLHRAPETRVAAISRLRDCGLVGIEAIHPRHGPDETRSYQDAACRLGLVATGGSDYHGSRKPNRALGMFSHLPQLREELLDRLEQHLP